MKVEPASLASRPLTSSGISVAFALRLVNATLDIADGQEQAHPYLASDLPRLDTDSWRVAPDGRMTITWRLRPNLTWHNGRPLTADDFAFAYRVYSNSALGQASNAPIPQLEDVTAPDSETVVFHWKSLYPLATSLSGTFQALPRHILDGPYESGDMASFVNLPFWTTDYVGLGPYKLERWDPGASIQVTAFEGHVAGRAKIDRVVLRFVPDENTALVTLLAGDVHFSTDRSIRFEQGMELRRHWGATGGTVVLTPAQPRALQIQLRPAYANPRLLLDLAGRQALAHATDREALNEGIFGGQGAPSETLVTLYHPQHRLVEQSITRYPFDPRRVEQLLNGQGYAKGSDGYFANASGERLALGYLQEGGSQVEREMSIVTDTWRRLGIDSHVTALSPQQLRDGQVLSTYSSIYASALGTGTQGGTKTFARFTSNLIGGPETRWVGENYPGWSNPEFDRIHQAFLVTLDPAQQTAQVIQLAKLMSDDLPLIMMYFNYQVSAYSAGLAGADPRAFDTLVSWNVHEWELK
jgi:peptide/nickel transport system substrate-binding protein